MPPPWTADQVLAHAPDASSAAAGRKLSSPSPWRDTGSADEPAAVWGRCQGSGKTPYETVVDLTGPAYKCSCPSRKFPCKHALGLLLLWSAGQVPTATKPAPFAQVWLDSRSERAVVQQAKPAKAEDPEAAEKRQAVRADKVQAGVDELDQWLTDQVRTGLSGLKRAGYRPFDPLAARMVDAQAPGLAGAVRRLPSFLASATDWPDRLLEQLALLRLAPPPTAGSTRRRRTPPPPYGSSLALAAHFGRRRPPSKLCGSLRQRARRSQPPGMQRWAKPVGSRQAFDATLDEGRTLWEIGLKGNRCSPILLRSVPRKLTSARVRSWLHSCLGRSRE